MAGRDAFVVSLLIILWSICFGLHLKEIVTGALSWMTVTVSAAADPGGYPVVSGMWPAADSRIADLRPGDQVVRVGREHLLGAGSFRFAAAAYEFGDSFVPIEISRSGAILRTSVALRPVGASWRLPLLSFGFALPGFLILWRRSGSRAARAAGLASVCFSLQWTFFFGGPPAQTYLWIAVFGVSAAGLYPLMLQAVLALPEERPATATAPRWTWLFSFYAVSAFSWVFGFPFSSEIGVRASAALNAVAPLLVLGIVTRSYVRSGPIGRRQLRWIVYGFYVGAIPVAVGSLLPAALPQWWWLHEVLMSSVVLVPLCFFTAIVRFNFLDIDRLITATLSYSILLGLSVLGGIAIVPEFGQLAAESMRVPEYAANVVAAGILAGAVVSAHRRLRPRIDRTLFADRYAVEQGIDELIEEIGACEASSELHELVGETLDRLLRPNRCIIYERQNGHFAVRFSATGTAPRGLSNTDSIIELLGRSGGPVSAEGAGPRVHDEARVHDALGAMDAAVAMPLRNENDGLHGIVCLGRKRTGDVYTPIDLSMLNRVAVAMSAQLTRQTHSIPG
jgi:hypothetical protein